MFTIPMNMNYSFTFLIIQLASESMGVPDMAGMDVHLKSGYNASGGEYMVKPIAAAEDIAPLAVYLASDESSFVNSASIIIDGGVCLSA